MKSHDLGTREVTDRHKHKRTIWRVAFPRGHTLPTGGKHERDRRKRQIAAGSLTKANGLA